MEVHVRGQMELWVWLVFSLWLISLTVEAVQLHRVGSKIVKFSLCYDPFGNDDLLTFYLFWSPLLFLNVPPACMSRQRTSTTSPFTAFHFIAFSHNRTASPVRLYCWLSASQVLLLLVLFPSLIPSSSFGLLNGTGQDHIFSILSHIKPLSPPPLLKQLFHFNLI